MERLERIKKETEFTHFNMPETGKFALTFNLKQDDFDWLVKQVEKAERYEKAFEYIDRAIYTQHCTMNHMENTEYEKGQISGLIQASNIVKKAKRNL